MKERHNNHSNFRSYFDLWPTKFKTGLSFGEETLETLVGTKLHATILGEKQNLKSDFDLKINPILEKHRNVFQHDNAVPQLAASNWDEFMFAVELWNRNSVNVIFDEGLRTCLIPVADFFNHSQCPHILYGRHDSRRDSIQFVASRPCKKGEQCYLSYGNLSSNDLVTFKGFLLKGGNYHDTVDIGFECTYSERSNMLRGKCYSSNGKPWTQLLMGSMSFYLESYTHSGLDHACYKKLVLMMLEMVLSAMCSQYDRILRKYDNDVDQYSWEGKLSLDYIRVIANIYGDALKTCVEDSALVEVSP